MSVSIGSKPIPTSGLTHLYDQLSPVCMPSGSEAYHNHLPTSYVAANAQASPSGTKNGLATYGTKTEHAHLKGYDTYDGSSDYWSFSDNSQATQPLVNFSNGMTFAIWARYADNNEQFTPRGLGGWTGNSTSYYYGYLSTVWSSSKLKPTCYWEPGTTSQVLYVDKDLDSLWHLWCFREVGQSSRNLTLDCGDWGSITGTTNVYATEFNTACDNFDIGNVQTGDSYDNSWLGDIGPFYIYNRAISDAELRQLYNANKDRFNY